MVLETFRLTTIELMNATQSNRYEAGAGSEGGARKKSEGTRLTMSATAMAEFLCSLEEDDMFVICREMLVGRISLQASHLSCRPKSHHFLHNASQDISMGSFL